MLKYFAKKTLQNNTSHINQFKKFNSFNFLTNPTMKKFSFKVFTLSPLNTLSNSNTENALIQYQKFNLRSMKSKRKVRAPDPKYKMKTHRGLRKRIRIIGSMFDRGFKHWPNNHRHKMINKSTGNLVRKRKARYICKSDFRRIRKMLPYFKRKKYKR
jgi:ribosomal protein L35